MCRKACAWSVTWVRVVVLGHLGAHMEFAPRLGQLDLALTLGQFFLLLGRTLVVAVGAAHTFDVVRGLFVLLAQGPAARAAQLLSLIHI